MAVSETMVREYFELRGFLVRQLKKYLAPGAREDDEVDFLVMNPKPVPPAEGAAPFVLGSADLARIGQAIVVVKAWHTDVFSPAFLAAKPALFGFLETRAFREALRSLGNDRPLVKLMVIPSLPQEDQAREQSLAVMRAKGIDGVIPFRTLLADLVREVAPNRNYQKSDLLQTLRILKTYEFFREPQLELFKPKRKKAPKPASKADGPV